MLVTVAVEHAPVMVADPVSFSTPQPATVVHVDAVEVAVVTVSEFETETPNDVVVEQIDAVSVLHEVGSDE